MYVIVHCSLLDPSFRMSSKTEPLTVINMLKWERRSVVLAAFGLVGFGCVVGGVSVYILHIKSRIEARFQLQAENIHELREDVDTLKKSVKKLSVESQFANSYSYPVAVAKVPSSDEDEEYATASESEYDVFFGEDSVGVSENDKENIPLIKDDDKYQLAQYFGKIDTLLGGGIEDQHEAYNLLKMKKDALQRYCGFWWRMAKATHMEGTAAGTIGNKESKRSYADAAVSYAEKALGLDRNSFEAHKWYAITVGNQTEFVGINDKIRMGYIFKEHIDRARELNPEDATIYYLLGRFCLDVSQLSWIERKAAATFFSTPPTSTPQEAMEYFRKCESLNPFLDNRFSMAKCYIAMGDYKEAAKWLQICAEMPAESASDTATRQLVMQLLPKYKKYLNP